MVWNGCSIVSLVTNIYEVMIVIHVEVCSDYKLDEARKSHKKGNVFRAPGIPVSPNPLLLFYAVECGLKQLLIQLKNIKKCPNSTSNIMYSHDLSKIYKELSLSRAESIECPSAVHLRFRSGNTKHVPFSDVHLAWRYGIDVINEDQILEWLIKVDRFIDRKRSRNL